MFGYLFSDEYLTNKTKNLLMKRLILIPFLLFSFFLILNASCPEGHKVFLPDGSTEAFFCEGISGDNILVRSDNRGFPKVYTLVDENGIILYADTSPRIPVSNLTSGSYQIYGVVFKGRLQEVVGEPLQEAKFSTFCHTISVNAIHLVIAETEISGFSFENGASHKELCTSAGLDDTIRFSLYQISGDLAIIAVDENEKIIGLFQDLKAVLNDDFSGRITFYSYAYEGQVNLIKGDAFLPDEVIDGCFSKGATVDLVRDLPNGGRLGFEGQGTELSLCPDDPGLSLITFSGKDFSPLAYFIFMVNDQGLIEKIITSSEMDLSGFEEGIYHFYGVSSSETPLLMVGDTFNLGAAFPTDCFDWSSRIPELTIGAFDGGELFVEGYSSAELFFCKNDRPDSLKVIYDGFSSPKSAVILTDAIGVILQIEDGGQLIISDNNQSELFIHGLAYSGNLLLEEGDVMPDVTVADGCYVFSEESIRIVEDKPSAESIVHGFPDDSVSFCTGDGFSFVLSLEVSSGSLLPLSYVLIDGDGRAVDQFKEDSFDLEGIEPGLYQLYGLSTAYPEQVVIGEILNIDSLECFELTDDFLTINARRIDGGEVFFRGGQMELRLCEKLGQDYKVRVFRNSGSPQYTSVLTDEGNKLLAVSEQDSINFIDLGFGSYRIWGIGHIVDLELEIGMDIFSSPLSSDCFAISEASLDLIIDDADGGMLELAGSPAGQTFCLSEVPDEWMELTSSSVAALNYRFLLVDTELRLIEVLDTNWINLIEFDPGIYSLLGVSYGGNFLLQSGDLITNPPFGVASDCHEFSSNSISLNIIDVRGDNITFSGGSTNKSVCPDGSGSLLNFNNPPAGNYAFLLLDEEGLLIDYTTDLELDVFGFDEGIYHIKGLAFLGNLVLETGISIDSQDLNSVCHDFSENTLNLSLVTPDGAWVTTNLGSDDVIIEVDQTDPDTVFFENNSTSNATYRYVITDTNDIVFAVIPIDFLVFNFILFEEFRVYGISYTGNLMLGGGQFIHQAIISNDCYSLSSNFVRVRLEEKSDDLRMETDIESDDFEISVTSANPFSANLAWHIFTSTKSEKANYSYQLLDLNGRLFKTGELTTIKGVASVYWETGDLPVGMYILRVSDGVHSKELKLIRK